MKIIILGCSSSDISLEIPRFNPVEITPKHVGEIYSFNIQSTTGAGKIAQKFLQ